MAEFRIPPALDGTRLDRALVECASLSRSQAAKLIKGGRVHCNNAPVLRPAVKVHARDHITLAASPSPSVQVPIAESIPLRIAFEDDDVIVVDKPAGMVVHPGPGHATGTLAHALLHHAPHIAAIGDPERPGIVHRLDKDTSGLLVAAKSSRAFHALSDAFRHHAAQRQYLALAVHTRDEGLQSAGTIETLHGRAPGDRRRFTGTRGTRNAITHYRVLEHFEDGVVYVTCRLETGRTHQIRMHLREQGTPILGDPLYGGRAVAHTRLIQRTALHAASLEFALPWMGTRRFTASPPHDFAEALRKLRSGAHWH